jgi:O-antigen ligase
MSSVYRTWQTVDVIPGERENVPSPDALVRGESTAQSRIAPQSQLYLAFHYVLLLYLFAYVARLPEIVTWLRVGFILEPILLVGLVLTKSTRGLLEMRSGRWLIAFTVWVAICVPFSFWPGGSFWVAVLALRALLLVAFMLAFLRSVRDVMRALTTVGLASGTIAIISFLVPERVGMGGRQGMTGSATLGDANFFALYLAVGVALLCVTVSQNRGWLRLGALALIPISLAGIARSGSRAGLLTLGVGLIVLLVYGSTKQRTAILSACLLGVLLAASFLPERITQRFTTLFTPNKPTVEGEVAAASAEARYQLLLRSLVITAKHPLFGVGPNEFMDAEAADAAKHGVRGAWQVTHNTYTQMSSELGIPGFILFAGALFGSYRGLSGIRKRGPTRHIRQMALFLQTAYFMLMVGAFFLGLGYGGLPFALIGLSAAFQLAVRRHIKQTRTPIVQPEMSGAV